VEAGSGPAQERASIAQFMLAVEVTRSRLQAEIRAARERLEIALSGVTPAQRAAETDLGALVLAAQQEAADIERAHDEELTAIREGAVAEATRLLTAARDRATAARQRAARLASGLTTPDPPDQPSPTDR
jgi:hypothetical protein